MAAASPAGGFVRTNSILETPWETRRPGRLDDTGIVGFVGGVVEQFPVRPAIDLRCPLPRRNYVASAHGYRQSATVFRLRPIIHGFL